jgi:hypothetical protein
MPQRRIRHVAGRPGLRPPRPDTARKKYLAVVTWPVRTGFRTVVSVVVAALTALAVAYVATHQDAVFDAVGDALGDEPILVHPQESDMAYSTVPLALPSVLSPDRAAKVANAQEYQELLESAHAVPIGMSEAELTFEGNRHESVIVESVTARVVGQGPPPEGTFLNNYPGGGPDERVFLYFDLDSPDKRARTADGELFEERNYIEIRRGEKLVFTFFATTRQPQSFQWVIDVVVQVGGRNVTVTAGANSPYSVTGPVDEYAAYYAPYFDGRLLASSAEEACPGGCTRR